MEEWREYLEYLANRLERCANSSNIGFGEERNEYAEEFHAMMDRKRLHTEDGIRMEPLTPEEDALRQKYFARSQELYNTDQSYNVETFRLLAADLPHCWD